MSLTVKGKKSDPAYEEHLSDWVLEMIELAKRPNVYIDISCFFLRLGGFFRSDSSELVGLRYVLKQISAGAAGFAHLRDKILFGTDWYLTIISAPGAGPSYKETCRYYFDVFKEKPEYEKLWYRFSMLNPVAFYRLDDDKILKNMYDALMKLMDPNSKDDCHSITELDTHYQCAQNIKDFVAKVKDKL